MNLNWQFPSDQAASSGDASAVGADDPPRMTDQKEAIDKRATVRLLRYWLSLRRVGVAPFFRDLDPRRNPVPWEQCFLVDAGPTGEDATFDHIGRALWVALDAPVAVGAVDPGLPKFLRHLIADLGGALVTGEPVEKDGCESLANGDTVLYRS